MQNLTSMNTVIGTIKQYKLLYDIYGLLSYRYKLCRYMNLAKFYSEKNQWASLKISEYLMNIITFKKNTLRIS